MRINKYVQLNFISICHWLDLSCVIDRIIHPDKLDKISDHGADFEVVGGQGTPPYPSNCTVPVDTAPSFVVIVLGTNHSSYFLITVFMQKTAHLSRPTKQSDDVSRDACF